MTSTVGTATEIRSFQVEFPEEELADLGRRIAATRWPEKEPVDDQSQGLQLATMEALVRCWRAYPDLIYFNEVDRGSHFAAWQEPELFTAEVRAAFRTLRPERNSS